MKESFLSGLQPQIYDIPKEIGSGLALLGLHFLGEASACTRRISGGKPVIYLHGTGIKGGTLLPLRLYQAMVGNGAGFIYNYETTRDFDEAAFGLAEFMDRTLRENPSFAKEGLTLVGHSLGGLILRRCLQIFPDQHPVKRVILLATPNYGSHLAHYFPTEVTHMMLPGSAFLEELNNGRKATAGITYTSIYGEADMIVLPRENMHLKGSECLHFPGLGHNNLVLSPRVFQEVARRISS